MYIVTNIFKIYGGGSTTDTLPTTFKTVEEAVVDFYKNYTPSANYIYFKSYIIDTVNDVLAFAGDLREHEAFTSLQKEYEEQEAYDRNYNDNAAMLSWHYGRV